MNNEKTTKLSDVLKGSQEVSSLDGNDRLIAIDANGSTKKISRDKVVDGDTYADYVAAPGTRWARIASYSKTGVGAGIIITTSGFWCGDPRGWVIAVSSVYRKAPEISLLTGGNIKVRALEDDNKVYIDVHSFNSKVVSKVIGYGLTAHAEIDPPTEGLTELLNKTLANSGGVICSILKSCKSLKLPCPRRRRRPAGATAAKYHLLTA